jgi:hypothetical protein
MDAWARTLQTRPVTPPRTHATFFASGFNTTVAKPTYENPTNYGDDVALRLASALREAGHEADAPYCEDWGWCVEFRVADRRHWLGVGRRPSAAAYLGSDALAGAGDEREPDWLCFVKRRWSLRALFKPASERHVTAAAVLAVHAGLAAMTEVTGLAWHDKGAFCAGDESRGLPTPCDAAQSTTSRHA